MSFAFEMALVINNLSLPWWTSCFPPQYMHHVVEGLANIWHSVFNHSCEVGDGLKVLYFLEEIKKINYRRCSQLLMFIWRLVVITTCWLRIWYCQNKRGENAIRWRRGNPSAIYLDGMPKPWIGTCWGVFLLFWWKKKVPWFQSIPSQRFTRVWKENRSLRRRIFYYYSNANWVLL